jgi:hypothetical protein
VLSGPERLASGASIAEVVRALQTCLPKMRPVESYR